MTGSAKTCQDARIFKNNFSAFYNSLVHGDYNALCFTSVACSVAKLRAPPSEMKLSALQSKFRILQHYIIIIYITALR